MGAGFLYKLWQLCFLDVSEVLRALLNFNALRSTSVEMEHGITQNGTTMEMDLSVLYNNYFKVLAISLLVSVVIIILLQKLTYEGLTKEAGIKVGIGLLVSIAVITNGLKLGKSVVDLGNAAGDKIYKSTMPTSAEDGVDQNVRDRVLGQDSDLDRLNSFLKAIDPKLEIVEDGDGYKFANNGEKAGIFKSLINSTIPSMIAAVMLLIFIFGNFVCILVTGTTLIARSVEIVIRVLGIPISALEFALNGYNSSSMRYIKSLLAVSIQGVIIVLILWLKERMQLMIIAILGDATSGTYGGIIFIILSLATVFAFTGLIVKSQQFAREVVGA